MEKKYKEPVDELFDDVQGFESIYRDNQPNTAFADDGFIHVVRNGWDIVFYNGQGKGEWRERDVPRFERLVDKRLIKK